MANFAITRRIEAPLDTVFALCSDFAHAADNISGIERTEMLTDGPVGVGTRFRETRKMFGKEATEEFEVTAFEPGKRYSLRADSCGARFDVDFRFAPAGAATDVTCEVSTQALTLFAKLMTPLSWMMTGTMKKCTEQDIDDIKAAAQQRQSAQA